MLRLPANSNNSAFAVQSQPTHMHNHAANIRRPTAGVVGGVRSSVAGGVRSSVAGGGILLTTAVGEGSNFGVGLVVMGVLVASVGGGGLLASLRGVTGVGKEVVVVVEAGSVVT